MRKMRQILLKDWNDNAMAGGKVSIIVPCYNLEKDIIRCLDSLCAQSYQNLEIIVVDDGSKDNSFLQIQAVAQKDSRIIAVSQENAGPSAARNHGMDLATGDYIMFVDGDDYVSDTYVEHFMEAADDCDLVVSGLRYVSPEGDEIAVYEDAYCCDKDTYVKNYYLSSIKKHTIFGPVIKLYRRDIIQQHKIRFDESIKIHEDAIFVMQVLEHVQRLRSIMYAEYCYVQHAPNASLVSKFYPEEMKINNRYLDMMVAVIGRESLQDEDIRCIFSWYLHTHIATVRKLYCSDSYTLRKGISYIYKLLHDETFRYARKELHRVAPKQARKFYRPLLVVHAVNYAAAKLRK